MSTYKTSSSSSTTSVSSSSYNSNDGVVHTTTTTTTKKQVNDGDVEVEIVNESSDVRGQVSYSKHDHESLPDDFNFFVKPNQSVDYKVSNCDGRKKSVLVGINYYNTSYTLKGIIHPLID